MSYLSPLSIKFDDMPLETYFKLGNDIIEEAANGMAKAFDAHVFAKVKAVVDVDEKELVKALSYDRDQYNKGYEDGKKDAIKWIPVSEQLPPIDEDVIVFAYDSMIKMWTLVKQSSLSADVYWESEDGKWEEDVSAVTHWMPLPNKPKDGET